MKPIAAIRLRDDGRCGCSTCLADEQRDQQMREAALAAIAHDLAQTEEPRSHLAPGLLDRTPGGYLVHP